MKVSGWRGFLLVVSLPGLFYGCASSHSNLPKYQQDAAIALSNANMQFEANHPDAALHLVHLALRSHQLLGDLPASVHDMNRIGNIKSSLGQYQNSLLWFHRANLLAQVVGDPLLQAETAALSSDTEIALKNDTRASELIKEGFTLISPLPSSASRDRIEAHLYNSSGILRLNEKKSREALSYFKKSLRINQQLNDLRKQAVNWANIGNVDLALGKPQESKEAFLRALSLDRKKGDANGIAFDSEGLVLAEIRLSQWHDALQSILVSYQIRLQQKNIQESRHDLDLFNAVLLKHPLSVDASLLLTWPATAN
ncbi:MAG: hypothetical protein ACYCYP_11245 [Leptospirales bacterium]